MAKTIILEEILWKSFYDNSIPKPTHTLAKRTQKAVKEAMKEACKQSLELAAENAWCNHDFDGAHGCEYSVDKQSILNTINQIE